VPKAAVMANLPIMVRVTIIGTNENPLAEYIRKLEKIVKHDFESSNILIPDCSGIQTTAISTIPATKWNKKSGYRRPNLNR
jgi:hypothetical protein